LNWILDWNIKPVKQDDSKATYCSKISKEDWKIVFEKEALDEIYNKFRAYNPWPWIYSYFNWKKINFEKITFKRWDFIIDESLNYWNILYLQDPKEIWVICKWWVIFLKQVKLEWKKSIDILSFINWNKNFLEYKFD
jgi:methionyl-tRNA formyltransferase